jgi:hypothetical protein
VVRRFERDILNDARVLRDELDRLLAGGQENFDSWLKHKGNTMRSSASISKQRDHHRRIMLRHDSAVG